MTSDPTPTITGDQRRLALRAAVQRAEQTLATANKVLAKTRQDLRIALYAYVRHPRSRVTKLIG